MRQVRQVGQSVTSLTACDNVTPVTVLQMKYMGQCPKCLGVYRGTESNTIFSRNKESQRKCSLSKSLKI
ncbi:MAG: hypothetical protein MR030_01920 [Bacteroidales bacterium]|nr:hypothetical protein [Bacteroidales bacterium]